MGRVLIRRTWPCGMQESIDAKGLFLGAPSEDDTPRLCPQHGAACRKGA